jgi:hypothetical protein
MLRVTAVNALLVAVGLLLLLNASNQPRWLRALALDGCSLADLRDLEKVEQARREKLDAEARRLQALILRRQQVIGGLQAGRLDLFAAATVFQELNGSDPCAERFLLRQYPQ